MNSQGLKREISDNKKKNTYYRIVRDNESERKKERKKERKNNQEINIMLDIGHLFKKKGNELILHTYASISSYSSQTKASSSPCSVIYQFVFNRVTFTKIVTTRNSI